LASVLLVDANVLIDYASSDLNILGLASRHYGSVHVPREILEEARSVQEEDCIRLGLRLVEATVPQLLEAGQFRGPLSFQDRLCLILARDGGWTCVTNDRALRRECSTAEIPVLWGLELMVALVAAGRLAAPEALRIARSIQTSNPRHITDEILDRFAAAVLPR
jgi:rRNA-processing protein FCF1